MPLPGYQCQQCWATFLDGQDTGDQVEGGPKCPTCHSQDVRKVDLPEDWVYTGTSGLCLG